MVFINAKNKTSKKTVLIQKKLIEYTKHPWQEKMAHNLSRILIERLCTARPEPVEGSPAEAGIIKKP